LELRVDDELLPRGPRDQLDGSVVVCRAEAARDDAEVRVEPIPQRGLELERVVAERSPRTSSLPVTTTNPRGRVKRPG
jgi:hypothetical protein